MLLNHVTQDAFTLIVFCTLVFLHNISTLSPGAILQPFEQPYHVCFESWLMILFKWCYHMSILDIGVRVPYHVLTRRWSRVTHRTSLFPFIGRFVYRRDMPIMSVIAYYVPASRKWPEIEGFTMSKGCRFSWRWLPIWLFSWKCPTLSIMLVFCYEKGMDVNTSWWWIYYINETSCLARHYHGISDNNSYVTMANTIGRGLGRSLVHPV